MNNEYIAVNSYEGEGYQPLIDFKTWRVAILRYIEELEIQNLDNMQKHDETDEIFVLLEGKCILFTGGKGKEINELDGIAMEPLKLYNVKQGVWHTHTLERDTTVLIVENQDTGDSNSPKILLSEEQKQELQDIYKQFLYLSS